MRFNHAQERAASLRVFGGETESPGSVGAAGSVADHDELTPEAWELSPELESLGEQLRAESEVLSQRYPAEAGFSPADPAGESRTFEARPAGADLVPTWAPVLWLTPLAAVVLLGLTLAWGGNGGRNPEQEAVVAQPAEPGVPTPSPESMPKAGPVERVQSQADWMLPALSEPELEGVLDMLEASDDGRPRLNI